ncbi:hypothetical protein AGMMS50249_7450 [candidate division SR1 bacterium]|nr:hypothetical protein AGMMS50249_7450 [candidate division SR1 bacterium]
MPLSCLDYAMTYLSKYPKTEQEMRLLLYKKGYDTDKIISTMETLKRNSFIDDAKYAESYFNSEVIRKGKPIFIVRQKLIQRGIDKKLIEDLISENQDEMNSGIDATIRKELQQYKKKGIDGFDGIQKLIRKGYRLQDIKDSIHNHTAE